MPPPRSGLAFNQVGMTFEGGGTSVLNVRSGKLRALAATGARRTDELPDVPTLSETIPVSKSRCGSGWSRSRERAADHRQAQS
jgi:tripartite-type tricarboxylate transporter receptor subunit TctC